MKIVSLLAFLLLHQICWTQLSFPTEEFKRNFILKASYNEKEAEYNPPAKLESEFVFNFRNTKNIYYHDSLNNLVFRFKVAGWKRTSDNEEYYQIDATDQKGYLTSFSLFEDRITVRYYLPGNIVRACYTNYSN